MTTTTQPKTKDRYFEATGGRKTVGARARIYQKGKGIIVNDKDYKDYFVSKKNQRIVMEPLQLMEVADTVSATVKVTGGGINAQAEAIRNALAKALVKIDSESKKKLRRAGFITRDSRVVERKKPGLKKARRAPQWKKR